MHMRRRKRHIVRTQDDVGIVHCKAEFVGVSEKASP